MKRDHFRFLLLVLMVMFCLGVSAAAYGATTSGTISVDETWSGTIEVTSTVTVATGATLKIDPGATVKFADGAGLAISGKLEATGTSEARIIFTSASSTPSAGIWNGITFYSSSLDTSSICNAVIEYASTGIYCTFSSPDLGNLVVQHNKTGINLWQSSSGIHDCTLTGNTDYGAYLQESDSQINRCTITYNTDYGLYLKNSSPGIDFCVIAHNRDYGVYLYGSSPVISNSHFEGNINGIYGNSSSGPTIRNSIIRDHTGYGIRMGSTKSTVIEFNTIVGNGYGVSGSLNNSSYTFTLCSNIIADNDRGIAWSGSVVCTLNYNDLWSNNTDYSGIAAGSTDFSVDPLFTDYMGENFSLQPESPLLTAGEGGTQIGAYGGGGNPPAITVPASTVPTTSGSLTQTEIWSGEVTVTADVTVPAHVALKINPGTIIRFNDGAGLTLDGKLIAAGTSDNPITFTSSFSTPTAGIWDGITFNSSSIDASIIQNANVEYAVNGIYCSVSSPTLANLSVKNNNTGVLLAYSNSRISGCAFVNNAAYGLRKSGSSADIDGCTFINNADYAIYMSDSNGRINACIITQSDHGLGLYHSSPAIVNNHFIQNYESICGDSSNCSSLIENNIIRNSRCGIYLGATRELTIAFNTFAGNDYAVYHWPENTSYTCTVNSNIFFDNRYGVYGKDSDRNYILSYNDFWTNDFNYHNLSAGPTDMSQAPLFVDYIGQDFTLRGDSPLLTAGEGGTQIGAYGDGGSLPPFRMPVSIIPTTSGLLTQNELWSGEIGITGDVTVPRYLVLRINPGTIVKFNDGAGLIVDGKLIAAGTSGSVITFTSASSTPFPGIWDGIKLNDGSLDTSIIENAATEYAENGIYCYSASPTLRNLLVEKSKTGISLNGSLDDSFNIEKCTISGCTLYGIYIGNSSPTISDNYFYQNSIGIRGYRSSPLIKNNVLTEHTGYGIVLYDAGETAAVQFNTITKSSGGMYFSGSHSLIDSNIITGNTYGIYFSGSYDALSYNNVWGNGANYYRCSPGGGDISQDPLFLSENDCHLQPGSPCIDRGTPYCLDEDGTRADVGAYGGRGGYNGEPDNLMPGTPVNVSPADGTTGLLPSVALSAGAFSDPDATDFQTAAQWQIRTETGDYLSPVFDSGETGTSLTSINIPCGTLQTGTAYFWHVRYKDNKNAWSDYSDETSFATAPDLIPPETAITEGPPEGGFTGPSLTFKWSGTDNSGCPPVYSWQMDGGEWSALTSSMKQKFSGLGHGAHVFSVKAMDGSNNIDGTPAVRSFNVDSTPPILSNVRIPPEQILGTSVHVLWETDEPASSQIEYWVDGAEHSHANDWTLETSHDLHLTGLLPDTTYHVIVCSRDAYGNQRTWDGDLLTYIPDYLPVADAGRDQSALTGYPFVLNGSESFDPNGGLITFSWSFLNLPQGSLALLPDPYSAKPVFIPDVDGNYELKLQVSDGSNESVDSVVVHAESSIAAPNADAGPDQNAVVGVRVDLSGERSSDPDYGPSALSYLWAFDLVPAGSSALITGGNGKQASFVPDVYGIYVLRLMASDSVLSSNDTVEVEAFESDAPPNADAGNDFTINIGNAAVLDASWSNDPDNSPGPVCFTWSFVAVPAESEIRNGNLVGIDTVHPSFVPDIVGTYVLELTASDGPNTSYDNVAVTVIDFQGLDSDEDVDGTDLSAFTAAFGSTRGACNYDVQADLDNDGDVDREDLSIFNACFGQ
ncbi:MAG: right-handed parallel beta-helix repeat-containing protein [Pseudomonadota bacterium]